MATMTGANVALARQNTSKMNNHCFVTPNPITGYFENVDQLRQSEYPSLNGMMHAAHRRCHANTYPQTQLISIMLAQHFMQVP